MLLRINVGTSGWYYEWNKDKTLDWYIENSGLNTIELNASFYRFPFPNQVKSWARKKTKIKWVIKVNRLITHQYKFSEKAIESWFRFRDLFSIMDNQKFILSISQDTICTGQNGDNNIVNGIAT